MPARPLGFICLRGRGSFLCLGGREIFFVFVAAKVVLFAGLLKFSLSAGIKVFFFFACEAVKVSLSALSFKFFVCASGVENSFGVLLFGMKCFMFTFG